MKQIITFSAILVSMFSATAQADLFCMDFSVKAAFATTILATAKCQVDQSLLHSNLRGAWTCSFNQEAPKTLDVFYASYLQDATATSPPFIYYPIDPGLGGIREGLGDFLFRGLKLDDAALGIGLKIELGETPRVFDKSLRIFGRRNAYVYFNIDSILRGKCEGITK